MLRTSPTTSNAINPTISNAAASGHDVLRPQAGTKRKAASQDNERLTKRLSLLNLERNGSKLYVPVENPSAGQAAPVPATLPTASQPSIAQQQQLQLQQRQRQQLPTSNDDDDDDDDEMHLDNSKHKVYIYDLDDELSSTDGDDDTATSDDGRLIFLSDIDKHLMANRIPPHILANDRGELAGMQMVLYSDPKSLSVSEEKDGVRKAIIESRNRLREKQRLERHGVVVAADASSTATGATADHGPLCGGDAMPPTPTQPPNSDIATSFDNVDSMDID